MIAGAQIGAMIYSRAKLDAGGDWQTVFLIRESRDFVRGLGKAPVIELRGGVIEDARAVLVVVIAQIAGELYETWFNYYQANGAAHFQDLQRQAQIALVFFTPQRARAVAVRNGLADFFKDAARRAVARGAWAMQDFDAAKDRAYSEFPEVRNLWAHLAARQ